MAGGSHNENRINGTEPGAHSRISYGSIQSVFHPCTVQAIAHSNLVGWLGRPFQQRTKIETLPFAPSNEKNRKNKHKHKGSHTYIANLCCTFRLRKALVPPNHTQTLCTPETCAATRAALRSSEGHLTLPGVEHKTKGSGP